MGKFTNLEQDIYSVFSSPSWIAENIKTYPSNFIAVNAGNEFLKVTIIASGSSVNLISVSGVLLIDIFTAAGSSSRRAVMIADILGSYFEGKTKSTASQVVTQFGSGSLTHIGLDSSNPSLFRSTYTIPFNYFGVM